VIQLIRDLHSDTEEFCDGMREFITDPEEGLDEMDAGLR
jgi:hypothetical protein